MITDESFDAVQSLTLSDKAAVTSGASFWRTKPVAGVPAVAVSDGPHGVRAQRGDNDHFGFGENSPATCFPPASGLSRSWDPGLLYRIGAAIAREGRGFGFGVILGPGVNIKRDPRCGRNFEYFSEDPYLTGALGTGWVQGLQSQGVGASVKHFAANNAEHDRMRADSQVDERALREIYLRAFERIVKDARPWTVMAAYNKVNGVYATENHWLLTELLRGEWGFDGVVVSDWGAVRDRVAAVAAGLDLAMPGGNTAGDEEVAAALREGRLDETAVDTAARNVVRLLERAAAGARTAPAPDFDANHVLAREAAARSIVLLKNDDGLLPLQARGSVAVIGRLAAEPRYQGGGSSNVLATRVDVPLDEIRIRAGDATVTYEPGAPDTGTGPAGTGVDAAVAAAAASDVAIVFLGLSDAEESEGFDRAHIDLSPAQAGLLRAVAAVQPRTVAVLTHGGVVRLAGVDPLAAAIVDAGLAGQAGGGGLADVLFGVVNPSGKLSETVPARLQDVPSYLDFPGENATVRYAESVFVGYRGFDARDLAVTYPFGHGLSYTTFGYADLRLRADDAGITVSVRITNTGNRAGREVVQFYVGKPGSRVRRAPRELKAFASVDLAPGESADVTVPIRRDDLAYWDERVRAWVVEDGEYLVSAAASSRDLRQTGTVSVAGDTVSVPLTAQSTLGEFLAVPGVAGLLESFGDEAASIFPGSASRSARGTDIGRMMAGIPLERLVTLSAGKLTAERLARLITAANALGEA